MIPQQLKCYYFCLCLERNMRTTHDSWILLVHLSLCIGYYRVASCKWFPALNLTWTCWMLFYDYYTSHTSERWGTAAGSLFKSKLQGNIQSIARVYIMCCGFIEFKVPELNCWTWITNIPPKKKKKKEKGAALQLCIFNSITKCNYQWKRIIY